MNEWMVLFGGALAGAVGPGVSILYAAYGEVLAERAGVINLGVEGCMLAGACFGFIATAEGGSPLLGIVAGALAGGLLSLVHAFLVVHRGANQIASGLVLTIFGAGLTAYIGRGYVGSDINGLGPLAVPLLSDIPVVGQALFRQDVLTYAAYGLGPLLWAVLRFTAWGLSLRAVGESLRAVHIAGKNTSALRYTAIGLGGLLAGLGGAQLALAYTHSWAEGMTAGRGFIAVALVIFALWNPLRAMVGALLIGSAIRLELQLQALGSSLSPFVLGMFPYLIPLVVLVFWKGAALRAVPEALKELLQRRG